MFVGVSKEESLSNPELTDKPFPVKSFQLPLVSFPSADVLELSLNSRCQPALP